MRLVIGGGSSGTGKTTITAGLIRALRRKGFAVQAFKAGPDYIDPSFHTLASGRPARNLDCWMLDESALRELFERAAAKADIAVVEGVMGLFDGKTGVDASGSTAELAKLLNAPVVLVVDVSGMARSAGAIVLGYRQFDPAVLLAGVILNNVGSAMHAEWVRQAIEERTGVAVLGHLARRPELTLPERHLGLVPAAEGATATEQIVDALADEVERSIDLTGLLEIAASGEGRVATLPRLFPGRELAKRAVIGVAQDEAFSFYYQDNLDLLDAWGAELVPFSPLHDRRLPARVAGIYIGGGFPEVFAEKLAANSGLRSELAAAAAMGMPVYAECGGLMYLGSGIVGFEGRRHEMVGAIRGWSGMQARNMVLGYRTVRARHDSILLRAGEVVRGHEFHWSALAQPPAASSAAYDVLEGGGQGSCVEGFIKGNLLASYVHLHFGSKPELAPRFVEACAQWRGRQCAGR